MVTGLADGRIGEESPWFFVVIGMLIIFILAMVSLVHRWNIIMQGYLSIQNPLMCLSLINKNKLFIKVHPSTQILLCGMLFYNLINQIELSFQFQLSIF